MPGQDARGILSGHGIDANPKEQAVALEAVGQKDGAFKITSGKLLDAVLGGATGQASADLQAVKVLQDLFEAPDTLLTSEGKSKFNGVFYGLNYGLNMSGQRAAIPGSRAYREVTAYHEAGHAVAALLLGIRVVEVSIDHRRPGAGQTVYRVLRSLLGGSREPWAIAPSRWARTLSREQRRAIFALAGPLTEARLLGLSLRTLGSIGDLELVHQLVRKPPEEGFVYCHGAVRPDANEFFEREIRRTRRILVQPPVWHAVSVVAGDLLTWGSLRGDDVAETVQWALGGCRQMGLFTGMNVKSDTAVPPRKRGVRARFPWAPREHENHFRWGQDRGVSCGAGGAIEAGVECCG